MAPRKDPMTPGERRWAALLVPTEGRHGGVVQKEAEAILPFTRGRFRPLAPRALSRHVYGNKPWAAQFVRPLSELIGKTNWELFPKETAIVFEASDQAARLLGEVSGLLESGLAVGRPATASVRPPGRQLHTG